MLLGNLLLGLAWAAVQGEFSLGTLLTGFVLGYLILLALVRAWCVACVATRVVERVDVSGGTACAPSCRNR